MLLKQVNTSSTDEKQSKILRRLSSYHIINSLCKQYNSLKERNSLLKVGLERAENSTQKYFQPVLEKLDLTLQIDKKGDQLLDLIEDCYLHSKEFCSHQKEIAVETGKVLMVKVNEPLNNFLKFLHAYVAKNMPPEMYSELLFKHKDLFDLLDFKDSKKLSLSNIFLYGRAALRVTAEICEIFCHNNFVVSKTKNQFNSLCSAATEKIFGTTYIKETCEEFKRKEGENVLVNDYLLCKTIGKGNFGKVKLCKNIKNGKLFAIKICDKNQLRRRVGLRQGNPYDDMLREIELMKMLNHPNIVRLREIINDPRSSEMYIVMEYLSGGPIMGNCLNNRLTEEEVKPYFADVIKGVKYLHSMIVVHRDLKPENILVSLETDSAKICDFNSAQYFADGGDIITSTAGTPAFMPPELCISYDIAPRGRPIDIWGLGVTLYCLVFGKYPFEGETLPVLYDNILSQNLSFSRDVIVSEDLKDLLRRMLAKDPKSRITIEEIQAHRWLSPSA